MNRFSLLFFLVLLSTISKSQTTDSIIEVTSSHSPKLFICNNVPCNGIKQGYSNGNIEIKGHFRKGKAIGKVANYTSTGQIQTMRYFRKGHLQRSLSYDSLGRLTRDLNQKKEQLITYKYDSTGEAVKKEVFTWKNTGWANGVTEIYEKRNTIWVKIHNRP